MSLLHALWKKIADGSDQKKQLEIALVASYENKAMAHYTERLDAFLKVMSLSVVRVTVYKDVVTQPEKIESFLKKHEKTPFDGVIALGAGCGQMLARATRRVGSNVPVLVLGYQELLPANLPHNVSGFFFPNESATLFPFFRKLHRNLRKIVMVVAKNHIKKVAGFSSLIACFCDAGIDVGLVYVDHPDKSIEQQFFEQKADAQMVYIAFDARIFEHTKKIAELAHASGILVVAGNLYAIHDDVDVVLGYPEAKIFRAVVHRLMMMIHQVNTYSSEVFRIQFELHCNAQNLIKHPYVLENISTLFTEGGISVHIHANKKALR